MIVKTPFFISPAYSVPRMTICLSSKERSMRRLRCHALGQPVCGKATGIEDHVIRFSKGSELRTVGRMSIVCMNKA